MIREEDAIEYKKELDKLSSQYSEIKEIVLLAENMTTEKVVVLSAINELRNAFDHVMRCHLDKCSFNDHISKARGHLYRAGYDAYEIIAIDNSQWIKNLISAYSAKSISIILPNYYQDILPTIDKLEIKLTEARAHKKVGNSQEHTTENTKEKTKEEFEEYSVLVSQIMQAKESIEQAIPKIDSVNSIINEFTLIEKKLTPYSSDIINNCIPKYYTEYMPSIEKVLKYSNNGQFDSHELDIFLQDTDYCNNINEEINKAIICLNKLQKEKKKSFFENHLMSFGIGLVIAIAAFFGGIEYTKYKEENKNPIIKETLNISPSAPEETISNEHNITKLNSKMKIIPEKK